MERSRECKKRFHAFEFNEVAFMPAFIRESTPEVLGKAIADSGIYEPVGRIFARFCAETGCKRIFNLCSGTGQPEVSLIGSLIRNGSFVPHFILSDLYPNLAELECAEKMYPEHISIIKEPVNAMTIPEGYS